MANHSLQKIITVAITAILVCSGFGCKAVSTDLQNATRPVSLEMWTVYDDTAALNSLIAKYRADHPYISITVRQLRADEMYPRLVEALAEDKGPDIVSVRNRSIRGMRTKLAPMPDTVRDATVQEVKATIGTNTVITPVVRKMLNPLQLDREYVQAVKNDVVVDGKIYGLPLSLDTMALFYNKDLLDRAGIPVPPKNWDEFQAAVKKLTKYDKKANTIIQSGTALGTGNNVTGSDDLLYVLFKQSGLDFVARDGRPVFNFISRDQEAGETPSMGVMNFYTDYANPNRDTYTWNSTLGSSLDRFVDGSLAFFFGYSYHVPVVKSRAPQLNLGILPLLQLNPEQPVNVADYWVQSVVAKSKHSEAAWGFIDYLAHSGATKEYLDRTGRPTAMRAFIASQSEKPELAPFISQVLIASNWYHGSNYEAARQVIVDMLGEWLKDPPDPERIVEWRQEILNRAASKIDQTF